MEGNSPGEQARRALKLQALYPASIVLNDQAMNITLCTYVDKIEFCIVTCSQILPHSQRLLAYMEEELKQFESLISN